MGNLLKKVFAVIQAISSNPPVLRKFFKPTVNRGKTVWPKTCADLLRHGVRLDYDGIVIHESKECHKFQLQPNAGKIPNTIRQWTLKNGGTHAVIGSVNVPVDPDPDGDIFEKAAKEAFKDLE